MLPVSYKSQTPLHAHQGVKRGLVMRSAFVLRLMPKTISLPFSCLARLSLGLRCRSGCRVPVAHSKAPTEAGAETGVHSLPAQIALNQKHAFFPCCHTPSPAEASGAKFASVRRALMILPPSPSPQRFCLRPRRDRAPSRCRVRRRPQCASTSRFLPGGSGSATPRPACRGAG